MQLKQEYDSKGYVLIRNFFSPEEIQELIQEIKKTSSENVSTDQLNLGNLKFNSLIMHKSQKLREFISQEKVVNLISQFIGPNFWVRWDQAVEKGPGAGTFPWHTDNSYSRLKDPHCQFWISLTKMTKENGGIWMIPGSHKKKYEHKHDGCHMSATCDEQNAEFISAEIGDIVVFNSFTLHSTTPNVTQESRWAYVLEYMNIKHIDPYISKPHLIIAKDGKPQLEYVDKLEGEDSLYNTFKYLRPRERWRKFKHGVLS
ncbi:MAG TPA: phytanoyl-CoA dioxygenase family protein [Methylotenera sp.]|nr:phytanoyl-CoA dioxygenase family protein [Methylotenera sp.]HPH05555.1 phytanoyl-CoA dioxygenase family protein [Methylotenera sp.]HPN00031.1 phytanoyl-CoA dioxygenase family protein [Methylotenera sp.]